MKKKYILASTIFLFLFLFSCQKNQNIGTQILDFGDYTLARVHLSSQYKYMEEKQKKVVKNLAHAATYADSIFLLQNSGEYASLLYSLKDKKTRLRFEINFGPWDIFHNNLPFIDGVPSKPKGAYFYPQDMIMSEFYAFNDTCKFNHYTMIRRNSEGKLTCVPYHLFFKSYLDSAIYYINKAIEYSDDTTFNAYLQVLIESLTTDDYYNTYKRFIGLHSKIEFIFGPTDITIDKLLNIKADYQAFVLIRDDSLSKKLNQYVQWLKYLQKALPVPEEYRREEPGAQSLIAVYDAVFLGGSAKAGVPQIATTIPFNTKFQINEGTKNVQLKNEIDAKYEGIIKPLSDKIIIPSQAKYVSKQAFRDIFLLYEIGNSLGIRNTVNGKGTVRQALKEYYSISNYIKNYLMVLFLAEKLHSIGELERPLKEYYYTFIVNIIRGLRWGSENEYGLASLIIINYLIKKEAINLLTTGQIVVNYKTMKSSIRQMLSQIIIMQGNGDYNTIAKFILSNKYISADLQEILRNMNKTLIPLDIYPEPDIKF